MVPRRPGIDGPQINEIEHIRIGNAMTYLAQALGINLMGVVSGRSAAELARWNQILRLRESMRGQKTGR
ncbi:MAG: hypothetical protein Tsb0019_27930 [Roseibium sp.]